MLGVLLAAAALILWALHRHVQRHRQLCHGLRTIPGPTQLVPVPFFMPNKLRLWLGLELSQYSGDDLMVHKLHCKYGPIFKMVEGTSPAVFVADGEALREVLGTKIKNYPKPPAVNAMLDLLGPNAISCSGKDWHRHRRATQHAFYSEHNVASVKTATLRVADALLNHWKERAAATKEGEGEEGLIIDPVLDLNQLTAAVITDAGFGIEVEVFPSSKPKQPGPAPPAPPAAAAAASGKPKEGDEDAKARKEQEQEEQQGQKNQRLLTVLNQLITAMVIRGLVLRFTPGVLRATTEYLIPKLLPIVSRPTREFVECLSGTIRKAERSANRGDVLSLLVAARRSRRKATSTADGGDADGDAGAELVLEEEAGGGGGPQGEELTEGLTDREVLADSMILFVAGQETTATALCWALHLLSTHQAVQDRLRTDVRQLLAEMPEGEDENEWLSRYFESPLLDYGEWVARETMRLYPPVPFFPRFAAADDHIGPQRYPIPQGTAVLASLYSYQRQAGTVHSADAEQFKPERWANSGVQEKVRAGAGSSSIQLPDQGFGWAPFSLGPRTCVGHRFALSQLRLAMAKLVARNKFLPVEGAGPVPRIIVTVQPANLRLRVVQC